MNSRSTLAMMLIFLVAAVAGADLSERLSSDARPEADRMRDAGRKPADVLAFLGVGEGMTVLDLMASSGYYTEVLSHAVGPDGRVYAQNGAGFKNFRDGALDRALNDRLVGDRLGNVQRLDRELADLGLEADSVDVVITALNFHDIYNRGGAEAANALLKTVKKVLKPRGVLGIIDHAGAAGADNAALHRIEESAVRRALEEARLEVEAESDLLRNPQDDYSKGPFDPSTRGRTDRFLLRVRNPE